MHDAAWIHSHSWRAAALQWQQATQAAAAEAAAARASSQESCGSSARCGMTGDGMGDGMSDDSDECWNLEQHMQIYAGLYRTY